MFIGIIIYMSIILISPINVFAEVLAESCSDLNARFDSNPGFLGDEDLNNLKICRKKEKNMFSRENEGHPYSPQPSGAPEFKLWMDSQAQQQAPPESQSQVPLTPQQWLDSQAQQKIHPELELERDSFSLSEGSPAPLMKPTSESQSRMPPTSKQWMNFKTQLRVPDTSQQWMNFTDQPQVPHASEQWMNFKTQLRVPATSQQWMDFKAQPQVPPASQSWKDYVSPSR